MSMFSKSLLYIIIHLKQQQTVSHSVKRCFRQTSKNADNKYLPLLG